MAVRLSNSNLRRLPKDVAVPQYDRSRLTPGIVHIGLGNFHRAHQAWYLHRLMQSGLACDWAIIGAGVRDHDKAQRRKLAAQDYLTTLIELDPEGISAEVVGSMIGYVPIEEGNGPLINQIADPSIRIVALTVTEGGYYVDPVTKRFNAAHPDIRHDAANAGSPRTAFGAIVAALRLRRDAGNAPISLQSCDNLQGNGTILRQTVVSLAGLSDPGLAAWIDAECTFPNAMVDRIVPATGSRELELAYQMGIDDAAPVTHERFCQWVMDDSFCSGRPEWERAGATFSARVQDYEMMKIRILNGGHQVISNPGEILSMNTIADCMANPLIRSLLRKVTLEEIVPHVPSLPEMRPEAYVDQIDRRFSNPKVVDLTRRVAFDGSSRHTGFILPVLREALADGTPFEGLALTEALWARMCVGTREDGSIIEPNDPHWNDLNRAAYAAKSCPQFWLDQHQFYGDLANHAKFAQVFSRWLNLIWEFGTEVAISTYLERR